MKGIILHGGHGTRLRPLTHTGPKQLLPIANKPMSKYALDDLVGAGIRDIAVILGGIYPEKVKEYYGSGAELGAKITYISQEKPGGIAQAIGLCKDFVGDDKFVVYLGDNILKGGITQYVSRFATSSDDAIILLCEVKNPSRFGIATIKDGKIINIVEKPKEPATNLAVIGIYFLTKQIFPIIERLKPSGRGELEITEALQNLLQQNNRVSYDYVSGWWKDTGTPEDVLDANRFILDDIETSIEGTVEDEGSIQGRVIVGKNTRIVKGAILRGPAIIGEDSIVESGVYIGPYTSIGQNVRVLKGEVENSIIMDGCEIDSSARITDSIIANKSRVIDLPNSLPHGHKLLLGERSQVLFG